MNFRKLDTRPPAGGWAPGDYTCFCHSCKWSFMGDKRAVQCGECAYRAEAEKPKRSPLSDRMATDLWAQLDTAKPFEQDQVAAISTFLFTNLLTCAWLGNATTGELLDEVKARVDLKYKTAGCDEPSEGPQNVQP